MDGLNLGLGVNINLIKSINFSEYLCYLGIV